MNEEIETAWCAHHLKEFCQLYSRLFWNGYWLWKFLRGGAAAVFIYPYLWSWGLPHTPCYLLRKLSVGQIAHSISQLASPPSHSSSRPWSKRGKFTNLNKQSRKSFSGRTGFSKNIYSTLRLDKGEFYRRAHEKNKIDHPHTHTPISARPRRVKNKSRMCEMPMREILSSRCTTSPPPLQCIMESERPVGEFFCSPEGHRTKNTIHITLRGWEKRPAAHLNGKGVAMPNENA